MFQSTLPRGERLKSEKAWIDYQEFQSTLPRGERQEHLEAFKNETSFNPRSRAGSDFDTGKYYDYRKVSIHAPARGATVSTCSLAAVINVSIHAPARGATASAARSVAESAFQSTLPRGERPLTHNLLNINNFLAILCGSTIFYLKKSSVVKGHFANIAI